MGELKALPLNKLFSKHIMAQIHYLNVKNGDCSFIKHQNGNISVIDVNNAFVTNPNKVKENQEYTNSRVLVEALSGKNYNQKRFPVNPIEYMKRHGVSQVFRFILTHPDMDHMDGIEEFFATFNPTNFWDTQNTKTLADFSSGRFSESDWDFYLQLKGGNYCKRLTLYDGSKGKYYNMDDSGPGGNGLSILAPTKELIALANESEDWNDSSYVILYRNGNYRILFCGDASDNTWDHLIAHHKDEIMNIDLLIAPHHGRKSSCSYDWLSLVNPKITFFGNADKASQLAHDKFNKLNLYKITNNQGNCLIAEITNEKMNIYVTNEYYAKSVNSHSHYNADVQGYFIKSI